ncbi:PAM68 family protein [Crocosphaera sp. XPORK-15E]|uniref:PAM68 family protein n=1 Tax=Crocosphaera sp. XPORK-15E TaxID=3110247 RepID=UPI002B21E33E|nr:PAM68 family protein [Crocosphaera sp. XPORK-15E]MEA5536098.1 PAM68 family protein [Crocosphaera sp. XPORK-15E]
MPSNSSRDSLPFEPRQKNPKKPKTPKVTPTKTLSTRKKSDDHRKNASLSAIPDGVSQRMIRRMAIFSGIPTLLGMSSFFIFYWIVSHKWLEIPTVAVGAVSLGLFGLGVLGLSYGIFSASWDENHVGGWWGWQEFTANLGRTLQAWRTARQETKKN